MIIDEIFLAMLASMRYKRSEIVSIVAVERVLLPLTPTVDLVDVLADIEEERLRRARRLDQACPLWAMPPWPDQRGRDCEYLGTREDARSRNTEGKVTKETIRPYYSSVSQRDDGLWYFIGRDGQTHGPFATERNAVKAERAQWERAEDAK